jgi:hypothetical protein
VTFYYACRKSVVGKPAHGHKRILTDSASKRNGKEVFANYNKTRTYVINVLLVKNIWMKKITKINDITWLKCNINAI